MAFGRQGGQCFYPLLWNACGLFGQLDRRSDTAFTEASSRRDISSQDYHGGDTVSVERDAMRDVRRSKKIGLNKQGKDAAIAKDIKRIILLTPRTHVERSSEASAWLCALYTGTRALTIAAVLLGDIIGVANPDQTRASLTKL